MSKGVWCRQAVLEETSQQPPVLPPGSSSHEGLQVPLGEISGRDLSGKPHIHGIWTRRAEAPCCLMVSELCREGDESGGEAGLLPYVAKPSTEPRFGRCHRSVRPRITGCCEAVSSEVLSVLGPLSLGSRHDPGTPCPPPITLHTPPGGNLRLDPLLPPPLPFCALILGTSSPGNCLKHGAGTLKF